MQPEFVLFYFKRRICAGLIAGHMGDQCLIELTGGLRVTYPAAQLLFRWQGKCAAKPERTKPGGTEADSTEPDRAEADRAEALAQLEARQATLTTTSAGEMNALHRRLPKGVEISGPDILRRALPGDADGWARARLYQGLLENPHLFRPAGEGSAVEGSAGGGFVARGRPERRNWETQQAALRDRAAWRRKAERWREGLERGERPRGEGAAEFVRRLASLLMEERQSPHRELLAQPLGLRRGHLPDNRAKLRGWLAVAGSWPGWPDMWLTWAGVAHRFPPELKSAAAALAKTPAKAPAKAPVKIQVKAPAKTAAKASAIIPGKPRSDFRKLAIYTIDAAGSKDIDDAIGILETDEQGLTLAMHIAQPPPCLAPGHALFEEAARRASSVYTPRAVFPMFPLGLSAGRFSLLRGRAREVVSFTLRITGHGGELLNVEEGLVRVRDNLDYGRADALMAEAGGEWARLSELCALLQSARIAAGARISERVEVDMDASDPARVRLALHDRRGPAQKVVEELSVLLNREAGRYCHRHGLPAIYRVQPRPRPVGKGGRGGEMIHRAAGFTTRGAPHSGLACDRYIQVTSPIRRFADLVMQQQIAGHAVHHRVTYPDGRQLGGWARAAEARMADYSALEARITDYWKRVYVAQHAHVPYRGTVRRIDKDGAATVWLEEVRLLVDAKLPGRAKVGDELTLRVELADPENHRLLVTAE